MSYVIACNRSWCSNLAGELEINTKKSFVFINKKEKLNLSNLKRINPEYIFFPHWSNIIPKKIHENYKCVIFHMTDLPYGRGGTPLQNLIIRGHKDTKISAIQCIKELDAGPIYLKKSLNLDGSAKEIFKRANQLINEMILEIIHNRPKPKPQIGKVVRFKRRKPKDGNLNNVKSLDELYDYIRMLDADGYPPAFIYIGNHKLEFHSGSKKNNEVNARVRITKEDNHE